jgi:GT2 family glycosyltransferase
VAQRELRSLDLVVATVDRTEELARFLASLERQSLRSFRVLLVDQNEDDRVEPVLRTHAALDVVRLRSERGLSRARNAALGTITADLVAFPDDDCVYPDDLLERVGRRFLADPRLGGLTGRGGVSPSWPDAAAVLTPDNVWNRAISYAIFLRADVVRRVGKFDEQLGLGSKTPWSSGEEIDYVLRALQAGARVEFDPAFVVEHPGRSFSSNALRAIGARDGASIGYILRKHRYPRRRVARMLLRPAGGALLATLRNDRSRARFHVSTLRGRLRGYRREASIS